MRCPHCLELFNVSPLYAWIGEDTTGVWQAKTDKCPGCERLVVRLVVSEKGQLAGGNTQPVAILKEIMVMPRAAARPPCPKEIPEEIAEDYREACVVLADSPKASAALSRRCLQNILREKAGVKPASLAKEIDQVLEGKSLPSHLANAIDAIRNIGNFAAHPIKSENTGQIVPVEPKEAEWNLDVLESMFDFFYVHPARLAEKIAALDEKLEGAGKPKMKGNSEDERSPE